MWKGEGEVSWRPSNTDKGEAKSGKKEEEKEEEKSKNDDGEAEEGG